MAQAQSQTQIRDQSDLFGYNNISLLTSHQSIPNTIHSCYLWQWTVVLLLVLSVDAVLLSQL